MVRLLIALLFLTRFLPEAKAEDWTLTIEHPGAKQFLAEPGERGILQGYASHGLEAWIYPFQIFREYRVSIVEEGGGLLPLSSLLTRTVVRPESVERIYVGQDFQLVEHWFVPRERPGMVLGYRLTGARPVRLRMEFAPVLDLMWPGGIGGQESGWDAKLHAFTIHETTERYTAYVGSPQIVEHSNPIDYTEPWRGHRELAFTVELTPGGAPATVAVALTIRGKYDGAAEYRDVLESWGQEEDAARRDYAARLARMAELRTPDDAANRAFAWAEIALEQAWVCNPYLGCGIVGGYGPSRDTRRPQYDWFFGGDGLVAAGGLNDAGDRERVADEFAFLRRYQNPQSGMMWHEISQSAGLLDWAQYPFQFRHVDISMDYLKTAADVWRTSGDRRWLDENWPSLQAAYHYISSLRDPHSGVPLIPAGEQGQNEQLTMRDELSTSLSMLAAEEGYAAMAEAKGLPQEAADARRAAELLRRTIPERYWNATSGFVYQGFAANGKPVSQNKPPVGAMTSPAFSDEQRNQLIQRVLQPDFFTAWGIRSTPSTDSSYNPSSYASGSVWPVANAAMATALWEHHRDRAAFSIWNTLVAATEMDAPGHIDEVLSGVEFRPLNVSVPEQTWSSAGFVNATVKGLLGYDADAVTHTVRLAPQLPAQWDQWVMRRLPFGSDALDVHVRRTGAQIIVKLVLARPESGARYSVTAPDVCQVGAKAMLKGAFPASGQVELTVPCPERARGAR